MFDWTCNIIDSLSAVVRILYSDRPSQIIIIIVGYSFTTHSIVVNSPQNDSPLPLNLLLSKGAVSQNVRQDLHGTLHISRQALGIEHSLLSAGVGIQMSSHGLNLQLQTCLGSLSGSLEGHMFQEVSNSIVGSCLVS